MVIHKFIAISLMVFVQFIILCHGKHFLEREKRHPRNGVNPLSEVYSDSDSGSAFGSGATSGSGLPQSDFVDGGKSESSGEEVSPESGMDDSFAEILSDDTSMIDTSGSSGLDVSDEASSLTITGIDENGSSNGHPGVVRDKWSGDLKINRRSIAGRGQMSMLEEFFKLMSAPDVGKVVSKRESDGGENDFENETSQSEKLVPRTIVAERGDSLFPEKELRVRKRDVDDLGDETIPNMSYLHKNDDSNKVLVLENDERSVELVKRNVMDGDNSVRFLNDVSTSDLFSRGEEEMLEQITRKRRSDNGNSRKRATDDKPKLRFQNIDFPVIKLVTSDSARPKRASEVSRERFAARPVQKAHGKFDKREEQEIDKSIHMTEHFDPKGYMRDQKHEIESVFIKRNIEKSSVEKRSVVMDTDVDADAFMLNVGRPPVGIKQKRHLRSEDIATGVASMLYDNEMDDTIGNLKPLENEYLTNIQENKTDNIEATLTSPDEPQKKTSKGQKDASKKRASGNNRHVKKDRELKYQNSLKEDENSTNLIGTFAKPTQVAGFWSGLGSKPIFLDTSKIQDESGSGLSKDDNEGSLRKKANEVKKNSKRLLRRKTKKLKRKLQPENAGEIMNNPETMKSNGEISVRQKDDEKQERKRGRGKRMDSEEENGGLKVAQSVLTFDDMHEVVSKNMQEGVKGQRAKVTRDEENGKAKPESEGEYDDEASGDDEESGEEGLAQIVNASEDDEVVVKTLSATYRENDVIDKRSKILVKRAPGDSGYVGCYVDVLHPVRDLAVRAGIPFVTIGNCRSACKRTGYYYAGLQFGYLCFCGNTYGKYDMAPDSECNYACSGDSNQTCGGLWRNSVYFTAGAPLKSNEGPVPFYLPPHDQASEVILKRSGIPHPESANISVSSNASLLLDSNKANTTFQTTQPPTESQPKQATALYSNDNKSMNTSNEAANSSPDGDENTENKTDANTRPKGEKRKVLMHFAYLHPQVHHEIAPTLPPAPTPPLRIEPQTRVFKGEIKLRQKWFDEFKDKLSVKSLILAGNVEQALKNIYANSSYGKDFLKAEVLSFREGLVNNNPYTVTRVIAEFSLTFDQNAISPDATLFAKVKATKKLDEMPVYSKSLKVSEYRFDPNSPNQAFKVPIKEPIDNNNNEGNNDDRRKSNIVLPGPQLPLVSSPLLTSSAELQAKTTEGSSKGMEELQRYLASENSPATPVTQQPTEVLTAAKQASATSRQGDVTLPKDVTAQNSNLSKRSDVPTLEKGQTKVPYILRLFFWKDMLARRKRNSANEKNSSRPLQRRRRGDDDDEGDSKVGLEAREKKTNSKLSKRFGYAQTPLTEESSFERRFMRKTKRKTKDLTTEKELRRSKRLDEFEDFD